MQFTAQDEDKSNQAGILRLARSAIAFFRPYLGWFVLFFLLILLALPSPAMTANRWIRLQQTETITAVIGPLAALATWLLFGWKQPRRARKWPWLWTLLTVLGLLLIGALVLGQLLARWLPGPGILLESLRSRDWQPFQEFIVNAVGQTAARYLLWWEGVQGRGAAQDELVFAGFVGALLWLMGVAVAWLMRATRQALVGTAPVAALLAAIVFYGGEGRLLFVVALALILTLHMAVERQRMIERWQRLRLDYSPDIFLEIGLHAAAIVAVFLIMAAFAPNLYIRAIAIRYAEVIAPMDERVDAVREQVFPNIRRRAGLLPGRGEGGLPNEFLLGAGPELAETLVMEVRTSEGSVSFDAAPPSHNLAGLTLATYDGRGWSNPASNMVEGLTANTQRAGLSSVGRRGLTQNVRTFLQLYTIYAASEFAQVSVDAWIETLPTGDLVDVTSGQTSYSVQSLIPALDEEALARLPFWGDELPLPPGYEAFLQLPDTVTQRTRDLAAQLERDAISPFAAASAIEAYLRTLPYDLNVPAPPADVADVADYFLFDLQAGYCDYYATAFVVLARLAGLPARFVTGYTNGGWDPYNQTWSVTAANAHSWPEVYFPEVGWIAFEPTAGRPSLERIGVTSFAPVIGTPTPLTSETPASAFVWNWQMLVWLIPLALLIGVSVIGVRAWRLGRADPWQELVRWGERSGRILQPGETVLEYGRALAGLVVHWGERTPDAARIVGREIIGLTESMSKVLFAPETARAAAAAAVKEHWVHMRGYLPRLRRRKMDPDPMEKLSDAN